MKYDDVKTWKLYQAGQTVGVFQCESVLVQHWLKKIRPTNLWELSACIAVVRPGALQSGFADTYVANRNNPATVEKFGNVIVDEVLKNTNWVLLFQESLTQIGEKLAWPHLDEKTRKVKADDLRKAVGKKDQSKILAIGKEFSDGCRLNGVPEDMITKLFEVIKNCGRYLFNLSHSFSYAYVSYETAYLKAHHPLEFFETTLNYSFEKPDPEEEKNRLIQDAKKWQIKTVLPNFNLSNYDFVGDQNVLYYGLGHIKFFGESYRKMLETKPQVNSLLDLLRLGFTTHYGQAIRSNTFKALILAGAFDYLGYDRQQLSHLVTTLDILSPKELSHFVENASNKIEELPALLNYIAVEVSVKKRKNLLTSESQILEKNLKHTSKPGWIEEQERNYLGCIISASASEKFEKYSSHRCLDIMQFVPQQKIKGTLIAVIDKVNIRKVSKGKNVGQTWATIDVHDSTGQVEKLCVFNTTFEECSNAVVENNVVQIMFEHNDRGISAKSITTLETV